jgi:hypothetical protein
VFGTPRLGVFGTPRLGVFGTPRLGVFGTPRLALRLASALTRHLLTNQTLSGRLFLLQDFVDLSTTALTFSSDDRHSDFVQLVLRIFDLDLLLLFQAISLNHGCRYSIKYNLITIKIKNIKFIRWRII